jgi:hypothetical protein
VSQCTRTGTTHVHTNPCASCTCAVSAQCTDRSTRAHSEFLRPVSSAAHPARGEGTVAHSHPRPSPSHPDVRPSCPSPRPSSLCVLSVGAVGCVVRCPALRRVLSKVRKSRPRTRARASESESNEHRTV